MDENVIADARADVDEQSSLFFLIVRECPVSCGDAGEDGLDFLFESEFADRSAHGFDFCAFCENDMNECVEAVCAVPAGIFDAGIHVEHEIRGERSEVALIRGKRHAGCFFLRFRDMIECDSPVGVIDRDISLALPGRDSASGY